MEKDKMSNKEYITHATFTLAIVLLSLFIAGIYGIVIPMWFSLDGKVDNLREDIFNLEKNLLKEQLRIHREKLNIPYILGQETESITISEMDLIRQQELISRAKQYEEAGIPLDVEIYTDQGLLLYNSENYNEAIRNFNIALKLNPLKHQIFIILVNLGIAYNKIEEFKKAIQILKEALLIESKNIRALNGLAWAYNATGKYDSVIPLLNTALEIDKTYVHAINNLGWAYHGKKQYDAAEEKYKEAISLSPNYAPALNNLAYLYAEQNKLDKALELALKASKLRPLDAHCCDTLAFIYEKRGEYKKAIEEYEKVKKYAKTEKMRKLAIYKIEELRKKL